MGIRDGSSVADRGSGARGLASAVRLGDDGGPAAEIGP